MWIKKCISILLTFLFLSCFAITSFAGSISGTHWAIDYADFCMCFNIIPGQRSNFSPDNNLSRAESTLALARIKTLNFQLGNTATPFTDVPSTHYYSKSIKWASDHLIVLGYDDGTFKPSNSIKRADFCVVIYRYCTNFYVSLPAINSPITFLDQGSIPFYAVEAVSAIQQAGIMGGYGNGYFKPNDPITRAEAACVLTKLYEIQYNSNNSLNFFVKDYSGNPISGARAFAYLNTTSYSDLYPNVSTISNVYGVCKVNNLSSGNFGVNVIANSKAETVISTLKSPCRSFVFVTLSNRDPNHYILTPVTGFTAIGNWPHNGINCDANCRNYFSRICPQDYFNVIVMQNFGWRYNMNSSGINYLDFHQAVDMAYSTGTSVLNCFTTGSRIIKASYYNGCGNTVQIYDMGNTGYYATYMHLNSMLVSVDDIVSGRATVATVGSSGTSSAHLHFSVSIGNELYAQNNESSIIEKFFDPLGSLN